MMKRITLFWCLTVCLTANISAQTEISEFAAEREAQIEQQSGKSISTIEELLTRIDKSSYTAIERQMLDRYIRMQNRNILADITPTAGETETFTPITGDFFFDTGGPGGGNWSGEPGNYTSCGCVTTTTLAGVTEIEFLDFMVFAPDDWLKIYDGVDTTGPVLFDNSTGGANEADRWMSDIIASNGSTIFVGTSGALTFELSVTPVIDLLGWEVEILNAGDLGANENTIEGFSYYPNPTDETLNLSSVDRIENVVIYNLLGQQVLSQDINAMSTALTISSLTTGTYLMKVTVNGQEGVCRIIKN